VLFTHLGFQREGPRCVHTRTERRQHTDAPVAELVAEALDDELPVGRQRTARRRPLLLEVATQVLHRQRVEPVIVTQLVVAEIVRDTQEGAHGPPELVRTAEAVAVPERHLAGFAWRGRHHDPIARDLFDAPRRGAEEERLPDATLVDHLLVELPHAHSFGGEHAEQTAIGDGAAARDREHARTRTG
jgi:hypothetical protein